MGAKKAEREEDGEAQTPCTRTRAAGSDPDLKRELEPWASAQDPGLSGGRHYARSGGQADSAFHAFADEVQPDLGAELSPEAALDQSRTEAAP